MISRNLSIIIKKLNTRGNQTFFCPAYKVKSNKIVYFVQYHKSKKLYHYTTKENCIDILKNGFIGYIIDENTEYFSTCSDLKSLNKSKNGVLYAYDNKLQPNNDNIFNNRHCLDHLCKKHLDCLRFEAECIEIFHSSDNQTQYMFNVLSVDNIEILEDVFNLKSYDISECDIDIYNLIINNLEEPCYTLPIEYHFHNSVLKIKQWLNGILPTLFTHASHDANDNEYILCNDFTVRKLKKTTELTKCLV